MTDWINKNIAGEGFYEPVRFSGFPEIKESVASAHIQATFMVAPLALALRQQGLPIKVVYLGHRDGTALVVHKDSNIYSFKDLKGKRIAIPTRYSNQNLILYKGAKEHGMSISEMTVVEMPPPDMPAALAAGAVDAITSGEPFMAQTEKAGFGRVLYQAKDIWPNFISCVLVVREDIIDAHPEWVQQLVDGIAKSGKWMEESVDHRAHAAEVVARDYYNQPVDLLRYVLTQPPDRVTYANLSLARDEFAEIEKLALEAGILQGPISFDEYADTSFSDRANGQRSYASSGAKGAAR